MKDLFLLRFLAIVFLASSIIYFVLFYREPNIYLAVLIVLLTIFVIGAFIGLVFSSVSFLLRDKKRFFELKTSLRKGLIVGIIIGAIVWVGILIRILLLSF